MCFPPENLMRHARHFNPEWGYGAPAPSVMRMDCLIVVAAIILAAAGGATVFSLLHRPGGKELVAARDADDTNRICRGG